MKNLVKTTLAILIIISLVLAVASCGGGGSSPKSLAKQSYDTAQELTKLKADGVPNDDPKRTALINKSEALDEKVKQLSAEDQKIFYEELESLLEAAGL